MRPASGSLHSGSRRLPGEHLVRWLGSLPQPSSRWRQQCAMWHRSAGCGRRIVLQLLVEASPPNVKHRVWLTLLEYFPLLPDVVTVPSLTGRLMRLALMKFPWLFPQLLVAVFAVPRFTNRSLRQVSIEYTCLPPLPSAVAVPPTIRCSRQRAVTEY